MQKTAPFENTNSVGIPMVYSTSDYYPFGSCIQELQYAYSDAGDTSKYRFGFNGMEKEKNSNIENYFTQFRLLDPSIGKWLSIDPAMNKYPSISPYASFLNNPILVIDPYGDDPPFKKYSTPGGITTTPESGEIFLPTNTTNIVYFKDTDGDNLIKLDLTNDNINNEVNTNAMAGQVSSFTIENYTYKRVFSEDGTFKGYFLNGDINEIEYTNPEYLEYTGQVLYHKNASGEVLNQWGASSGMPEITINGINYPDMRNSKYAGIYSQNNVAGTAGPIKEGLYSIKLEPDPNRVANELNGFLISSPQGGIEQIPLNAKTNETLYRAWGYWRMKLDGQGSNVYIHNSGKGYTHGCIETKRSVTLYYEVLSYRNTCHSKIYLIVDYPESETSTSGDSKD